MERIGNPELLRTAIRAIEQKPHGWDQGFWGKVEDNVKSLLVHADIEDRDDPDLNYYDNCVVLPEDVSCGTSMCLAGQVVSQAGFQIIWWEGETSAELCWNPKTQEVADIMMKAKELLGIDSTQASRMFSGDAAKAPHDDLAKDDYDVDRSARADDISIFKRNLTHWTGVEFPAEESA